MHSEIVRSNFSDVQYRSANGLLYRVAESWLLRERVYATGK